MERIRKMRAKKKIEMKHLISDKIMDIIKKLENKINKPASMDDEGKNREILMVDNGFYNLINSQNIMENIDISKIKEKNDNPQTQKLFKIYQKGIQNKSKYPPSLFNIIITIIIFIYYHNVKHLFS